MENPTRRTNGWTLAVLAAAMLLSAQAANAAWWVLECPYRRVITVPATPSAGRLPGHDVGTFTMATSGLCKSDGSDIRVLTHDGKVRPMRILMTGSGEQIRIAFALEANVTTYHVYFGATRSLPPADTLEIMRGVLLESYEFGSGAINTYDEVKRVVSKSKKLVGRQFVPNIFQGVNPFGPQDRLVNIFTGWLNCPQAGKYIFVTASHDASFLVIDNTCVVKNGGFHEAIGDTRYRGTIDLVAGLHKLTFYHVNGRGNPIAVAAWQTPGMERVVPIPPDAFAPVSHAAIGPIEQYGRENSVDFTAVHAGEAFLTNNVYLQRYTFTASLTGPASKNVDWRWDFGDGQTSSLPSVDHVYLTPGEYTVTLEVRNSRDLRRTSRIVVDRPWERVMSNELDGLKQQADIVESYNFERLSPESLAVAAVLADRVERKTLLLDVGRALVGRANAPARVINEVLPLYGQALIEKNLSPTAVAAYLKAERMSANAATRAAMLCAAGAELLKSDDPRDLQQALDLFTTVVEKLGPLTTSPDVRRAKIGVGDVWRRRLDYDKAAQAYASAGDKPENNEIRSDAGRGDFERHVEEYLRRKDWKFAREYLDRWAFAFPADKLDGYWSLLKVRLAMAEGDYAAAFAESQTLVGVNAASNYAPQLLLLQSQALRKLRQPGQADDALRWIVERYKESPLAAEAAKTLGQAETKKKPDAK